MENETLSLEEVLLNRLATKVKDKYGNVMQDDNGDEVSAVHAIAISIIKNAMKGDVQAATFVCNITSVQNRKANEEKERLDEQNLNDSIKRIRTELENDDLYVGQDVEIESLAHIRAQMLRIERQMRQQDLMTDYKKDGSIQVRLNPLHDRWDKLQRAFIDGLKELRNEAIILKLNQINK